LNAISCSKIIANLSSLHNWPQVRVPIDPQPTN